MIQTRCTFCNKKLPKLGESQLRVLTCVNCEPNITVDYDYDTINNSLDSICLSYNYCNDIIKNYSMCDYIIISYSENKTEFIEHNDYGIMGPAIELNYIYNATPKTFKFDFDKIKSHALMV